MISLREFIDGGNFLLAAHRGASGLAPENTLSAFRIAAEQGANMIETDLQFTDDGHIVAFHDLKHLKAGNNINKDSFKTVDNVKSIDAGSWFDRKFKDEKIPVLEEILEFAKDKVYLNLEIKAGHREISSSELRLLIDTISKYDMKEHLLFSSFDYDLLKLINNLDAGIHLAAIKTPFLSKAPHKLLKQTGAEAFICSLRELNEDISRDSLDNNFFLGVYSVDDEKQLKQAMKFNVSAIGTNYPARIKELLQKHRK